MKKRFNRALIYEWFNSAKAFIGLGILIWGINSFLILDDKINTLKVNIGYNYRNCFRTIDIGEYIFLAFIFIGIYYAGQGINKRNNTIFLYSGPFTRKEIKNNAFICMIITLILFAVTYIYIMFMIYLQNKNLLSISYGFEFAMLIEITKFFIFGIAGILILCTVDALFKNIYASIIFLIAILPSTLILIIYKFFDIVSYIPNINMKYIFNFDDCIIGSKYLVDISERDLLINICFYMGITFVLYLLFKLENNKERLECNTNIFTSKLNRKIAVGTISFGLSILIETILYENFTGRILYIKNIIDDGVLYGGNLVLVLSSEIFMIFILSTIIYIITNKILKRFS